MINEIIGYRMKLKHFSIFTNGHIRDFRWLALKADWD